MTGLTRGLQRTLESTRKHAMRPRAYALVSGLALIGSFVSVLYYIVDIVGGVTWLLSVVVVALVVGTAFARFLSTRFALGLGLGLLAGGACVYVLLVPEHHDAVTSLGFIVDTAEYLTGVSVLYFLRVDVWAVAIAPGPTFLTWYLLLRRRYDLAVVVGGLTLGFFVLTGDAGWTTTLVGSLSVFGVLGFGSRERVGGSRSYAERLGDVFVASVLASQMLQYTDWVSSTRPAAGPGGASPTTGGTLTTADEYVTASGRITLSPRVIFTVTADREAYWHADAYDRYTGSRWIRSGQLVTYEAPLRHPDGATTTVQQTFRAVVPPEVDIEGFSLQVMPAAWKPVRVLDGAQFTAVTSTGTFVPTEGLDDGEKYTVVSEVPDSTPTRLRNAGTAYPREIRDRYLQVPESTPDRVGRRTREVAGEAATPYDAARAIEAWLEANKEYSWDADRPAGDLADAFLFSLDRGYCVHYATAMAVMLRTLGIPARLATGYTTGQRVAEDRWIVRGLDSHAWVDVYFPGSGWITFDPTPSDPRRTVEIQRLEEARAEGLQGVDTDETRSNRLSVDATPAESGLTAPGGAQTAPPEGATDAREETTSGRWGLNAPFGRENATGLSSKITRTDRVTLVAGVIAGLLGVGRLGLAERGYRSLWLRWQPSTDSPRDDVERAFERLEYLLGRRHRPRATGETPRQYLAALDVPVDRRARRVVELHERARYADGVTRREADEAIRCVNDLVEGSSNAEGPS
jgi:transglutaminase-like putative cysteine protease